MADLLDEFGLTGGQAAGGDLLDEFGLQPSQPKASGIIDTVTEGAKSTGRSVAATVDAYTGDTKGVTDLAAAQQQAPRDPRLEKFQSDYAERTGALGDDPDLLPTIGQGIGAIVDNPAGAGLAVVEQLPNAAVTLGGGYAGLKGGAAIGAGIGSLVPVVGTAAGAAAGGVIGGLAGMFLGNAALETGQKAMAAADDGEVTQDELAQARREGAVKGGVITGVDALTLGVGGKVASTLQRTSSTALEAATRKVLVDNGVDVANEAAVLAARSNPTISAAVQVAQDNARKATDSLGRRMATGGALLGMETVGEGVGEYLGELAATGQGSIPDAVLESLLSLGQSGVETSWNMARTRRPSEQLGIDPSAGPISAVAAAAVDGAPSGTQSPVADAARASLRDRMPAPEAGGRIRERDLADLNTSVAQQLFSTELDDAGKLRYYQYDQNLQSMAEVPEAEALAAAKQHVQKAEAEGFDPLDSRRLGQLMPQVEEISTADRLPVADVEFDTGPQDLEVVDQRPPLPTVEMDTGPQSMEQVQVAARAEPLALPAPSTMVVDREGNARPDAVAPFVPNAERKLPGGPGMDQQASGKTRPSFDQILDRARANPAEDAAALAQATGATRLQAGRALRGAQTERAVTGQVFKSVPGANKALRELPVPGAFEVVKSGSREWRVQRKQEVQSADRGQRAADVRVAGDTPAAPAAADNVARVPVVAERAATADQPAGQDRADVPAAAERADEQRALKPATREPIDGAVASDTEPATPKKPQPEAKAAELPDVLAMPRKRYIAQQAKAAGLKKGSPGYDQAIQRLQSQYEADVDRASAGITFEQFNAMNSDSPESLNRQAWEALRQEFGQVKYSRGSYRGGATPTTLEGVRKAWQELGIDGALSERGDVIIVSKIISPTAGEGRGTKAMQVLVDYADQAGKHVALSPSADFGGNRARLIEFYKRFGFVENKGRDRAFQTMESMYRAAPGQVLYSRPPETASRAGSRAGQLRMAIAQMTRGWKNAPDVTVVQSIKDLPTRQRQRVERDGAFDVEGIFADGKVYLVADNLTGARHAAFVLQHEVLGHAGLQGAYGQRLTPLLMSIYSGNAQVKSQADALVQRLGYTKAVATEEVLADMAGAGTIARQPFWQRLVTAMRNTFRSLGLGTNWTEGDIQGLLANARAYIESGRQQRGARAAFSRDGRSGRGPELVDTQGRLLAPNGKSSQLNQRQWHQVRSANFKRWFGDWKAASAMERLAGMVPVRVRIPDDWRGLSIGQLRMKAKQAMQDIARSKEPLVNDTLGEVEVSNNTGVRKFISGGADPAKLHLAADLRETFRKAIYTSSEVPSDRAAEPNVQAYEKLIARAEIDGQDLAVVFTVQRTRDGRQFYNATTLEFGQKETPVVSPRDTPIAGERATSAYTGVPSSVDSTGVQAFSRRELERVNPDTVSKVTDGNGEPLVVYHGTTGDFDAFARETIGSNIVLPLDAPRGFYFAKDQATADRYAAGDGANVMPVFVAIKNPAPSFADFNADTSYDGFINSKMVVARNPEQVKSATANVGTFDPADSDIRYSRASQRDTEALRKLGLAKVDAQSLLDQVRNMTLGGLQTKMREWSVRSEEGVFDGLAGIRRAEEAVGVTDVNQQGYVSARMASGIADVMHGVLHYAAPEWRDGVVSGKANTRGVLEILGDLGPDNLTPWLAWLGGKRAQLLKAQGRENNLTDAEISELVAMGKGSEALFEKVYREYAQVNEAVLDLAQEAGLIDQDARAKWLTEYYVPFYRQDESEGIFSAPRSKRGLSHQTAAIKALKGGDLPTNDLLANMLAGWTKRIDASMKNKALLEVVGNLQGSEFLTDESPRWQQVLISRDQIAQQIRKDRKALALAADLLDLPAGSNPIKVVNQLMKPENEGFEKLWTRVAPTDPDIIRVQRDGKAEYYRVNDESLLRGLKFMEGSIFNDPITKIGRAFKRILTTGVTASPDFILRNFIRDAAHAWVINKDGFTLGKDSIKGMRDALREDADYRDLMFAGGSFQGGYVHGADPEASAQIIRRALEKKGFTRRQQEAYLGSLVNTPAKAAAMLGKGWQHYRELGDKVENANRLSTYKAAIAAGKSRRQASYEAKDLMDYSLRGNFAAAQWFTDVVPFLNARLQGLYKLGRAVKGDKTLLAKEVAMKGGYIALFSLLLAGINDDDERYKALMDWDKDMHWHIFLGDEHFRIPKPFELGLVFGTVPERILHAMTGTQDGGDLAKAVSHGVFDTLAFNPVPQFYQPIRELQANRNFFRDSPIEDMSDEGKLPEARYDERTSMIGRMVGQVTGPIAGLSPKQIDHLIAGYTGTLGQYVLDMSSLLASAFDDADRPASRSGDIPILKVLYQGDSPRSTKYQSEFYDMMREADQLNRTIKSYREEGRLDAAEQLMSQNREKLRHRPALGLARKQLGNIRNQMDAVYRDTAMTPEQKRQRLDALQVRANGVAERIVNLAGGDF